MKKGPTKNSNTENTLETLPQDKEPQLSKPMNQQNFAMTSTESNATTGLESAHEKKVLKYPKKLEPSKSSDQSHLKLINSVRETFLTIRQKTLSESPSSILNLKKSIPFEDPEDTILSIDPVLLLQYIKQIFDKVLENKNEAEKEILHRNENECGDYESMLQKLEAEVRQHIRIEQQLKLYVESVQSKLEEHEKEGDLSRVDLQKELEILQQDNITLSEKIKDYEEEVKGLKKKLSKKVEAIEKLERQIENIPILKKMIREMDKVLDAGPVNRSLIESTMRGSQRSNKDIESSGYSNAFSANESRMRKSSHPVVGSHSQDKHKESNDHIKIKDVSALGDKSKYKEGSIRDSKIYKEGSKFEGHSLKSTARLEDKNEEPEEVPKKVRASVKGESNRRESRERHTDQDGLNGMKNKEDIIEPSRFSVGNAFKAGMEEFLRKSFEKEDVKAKKKTTESSINRKTTKVSGIENTKDKIGYKAAGTKASRPGTAGERLSHNDHTQHSADPHFVEAYKSKEIPSKKHAHDRSQSVEPKKKFLRQHKSRGSINEDEVEEHHRKQASFSGHQRTSGHAKQNQSGSGVFSKSHS